MAQTTRAGESLLKDTLLPTLRSLGFWSFVLAIVGAIALIAGIVIYLTIEEIRGFAISVLSIGALMLFLALVLSPRAVALFLVGRQGRYGSNVLVMSAAFFAIAILVNFLTFRNPARMDVTATRVFTLAPQTVQVLENLQSTIRANAFFVPNDSRQRFARQQAEDLLNEFSRRSEKFEFRFIDPELNPSLARRYNVTQYPAVVFEDVERGTQQQATGFTEQRFLTAILSVTGIQQKRVYYLIGHKERDITRDLATGNVQDEGFDLAVEGMERDNYTVLPLNLQQVDRVPEDTAVLVIAGPRQEMSSTDRDKLIQYIKRGGRIVALLDPETPPSFVDLISRWGFKLGGYSIADAASSVGGEMLTPLLQRANGQYTSSEVSGVQIADQVSVTFYPGVTSIEPVIPLEDMPFSIQFKPLGMTTPASWLETDVEHVNFEPDKEVPGPFVVAAVVEASGTVDEKETHPTAKFIIFGDSDFIKNNRINSFDNQDMFLNSVNWLAEDFNQISIRPKLYAFRELVVTSREREFIKWTSWLLPPSVMVLLGAIVWWRRR